MTGSFAGFGLPTGYPGQNISYGQGSALGFGGQGLGAYQAGLPIVQLLQVLPQQLQQLQQLVYVEHQQLQQIQQLLQAIPYQLQQLQQQFATQQTPFGGHGWFPSPGAQPAQPQSFSPIASIGGNVPTYSPSPFHVM